MVESIIFLTKAFAGTAVALALCVSSAIFIAGIIIYLDDKRRAKRLYRKH